MSKRNNPCMQPAATCRYHGPNAMGRGGRPGDGDELGDEFDDLNDDEAPIGEEDDDDEAFPGGQSELALLAEIDDIDMVSDEEVKQTDVFTEEVDDYYENLDRFQQKLLHKSMPNTLYMDSIYTEIWDQNVPCGAMT